MDPSTLSAFDQVRAGDVASIGTIVMLVLRLLKQVGIWPKKFAWSVHLGTSVLAFLGALFAAKFGAAGEPQSWVTAALTAGGAALSASGLHEATKATGEIMRAPQDPTVKESGFSKFLSIFLPRK